jgi:hypothetical protein
MKIKYIDFGIGFLATNDKGESWIELNKHLKKYPKLHKEVLDHELGHATGKDMDFWHDVKDFFDFKKQWALMKFTFKHPSALMAVSPFLPGGINWFMLIVWILVATAISVFAFLLLN